MAKAAAFGWVRINSESTAVCNRCDAPVQVILTVKADGVAYSSDGSTAQVGPVCAEFQHECTGQKDT